MQFLGKEDGKSWKNRLCEIEFFALLWNFALKKLQFSDMLQKKCEKNIFQFSGSQTTCDQNLAWKTQKFAENDFFFQKSISHSRADYLEWKSYFGGVTLYEENLPSRNTEKRSLFDWFLTRSDPTNHMKWRQRPQKKCENNASWSSFCVKICEMCYF